MLRKFMKATLAGVLGLVALALALSAVGTSKADDKKDPPTIKEIMQKGHKGTDAYIGKIRAAAKAEKWDDAKEPAKALAFFGENLGKNKPPKGDEASWEKLTKKYTESTKAVLKGVEDKDAKAVSKGLDAINCMECHKAHR